MAGPADTVFDEYNRLGASGGTSHRADPSLAFESADLRAALEVWRSAARERPIPLRSDLTPRAMKGFLPKVAIVDVHRAAGRTRYKVRTVGTQLERIYAGMTGKFLDECVEPAIFAAWEATLELPLRSGVPVRFVGRVAFRKYDYLSLETLLAPMGTDPGAPDSVFIALHARSAAAKTNQSTHTANAAVP